MVARIKVYRNNQFEFISLDEYFLTSFEKLPDESKKIINSISQIPEINTDEEYQSVYNLLWINFDPSEVREKYLELANENLPFDDDIIRFIAFLKGTNYFELIGHSNLTQWLSAPNLNKPTEQSDESSFSLLEASKLRFGQNAIRAKLLTTLKYLSAQGG